MDLPFGDETWESIFFANCSSAVSVNHRGIHNAVDDFEICWADRSFTLELSPTFNEISSIGSGQKRTSEVLAICNFVLGSDLCVFLSVCMCTVLFEVKGWVCLFDVCLMFV